MIRADHLDLFFLGLTTPRGILDVLPRDAFNKQNVGILGSIDPPVAPDYGLETLSQ